MTRSAEADPRRPVADPPREGVRLQKVLARAGIGSRRVCDDLIAAGRVRVNGERAEVGQRVDPRFDRVVVDGVAVPVAPGLVYYLVNKPAGVVTTASDPEGRRTVLDLVPTSPRVFPVGRLDYDTEGLIVCTNDGELAHRLAHPSYGVAKEYLAEVEGTPGPGALRALREGVELDDGRTAPAVVGHVAPGVLRIVVHEGRNRQVRRMLEAVGHPVRRLVRTRIGPVADPALRPGHWRMLRDSEVRALYAQHADALHADAPHADAPHADAPHADLPHEDGGIRASRPTDRAAVPTRAPGHRRSGR
jgi:23S rRNA pseudouridine2605 synthase